MNDLHKPNYLDAKMELGTQVQFFSFTLNQLCSYLMVLAFLTLLLLNLIPTYYTEVLSLYSGSFITMVVFYIKYGTNQTNMEERKELVEKLRVIANRIERNRLDYRYAYDRIILDKLYEELNQTFNNYLKIKNENENKVKSIKFMNYGKSSEIS